MIKILIIVLVVWLLGVWYIILSSPKRCPNCGGQMDKAGNNYLCRDCHKYYYMNMFGVLKEEQQ